MRDVQQLCAVLAAILFTALVYMAGIHFGSPAAAKLALVAAGGMYIVQALDAFASDRSLTPDWLYGIITAFWVVSFLAGLSALMLIIF